MRGFLMIILFLIGFSTTGQGHPRQDTIAKNSIYAYVGTTLAVYATGFFYERNIYDFERSVLTARGGAGVYAFLWGDYGHFLAVNAGQLFGKGNNHFEYNIGYTFFNPPYTSYSEHYPSAYIGYRYQKPEGGFIFRTGFGWPEQVSIGAGISF